MRPTIALAVAILAETTATLALRASIDAPAFLALVALGYTAAFALLGIALRGGMPLGVAYGIWGASGVALTAALGAVLFDEHLRATAIGGIALIIAGVVLVETGSGERTAARADAA